MRKQFSSDGIVGLCRGALSLASDDDEVLDAFIRVIRIDLEDLSFGED